MKNRLCLRRLALACLVGLLGATVVGCARAAPPREPATISFAFPEIDTAHYEALVQKFDESHPQITVELRPKRWQDVYNLETESADVFWVSQNSVTQLLAQGKILNLSSLVEQDDMFRLSAFYPDAVDVLSREGKTWAIPCGADVVVMYYSRDLFDQYNVPYPDMGWTWDGLLERAVAIRDPDAGTFGYGPRLDLNDAAFFIYQHGGRIF